MLRREDELFLSEEYFFRIEKEDDDIRTNSPTIVEHGGSVNDPQ